MSKSDYNRGFGDGYRSATARHIAMMGLEICETCRHCEIVKAEREMGMEKTPQHLICEITGDQVKADDSCDKWKIRY